jgi:regulator of replication initiation timing
MSFLDDPLKAKRAFYVFLILTIVFFLTSAIFGFLLWQKSSSYQDLSSNYQKLQTEIQALKNIDQTSTDSSKSTVEELQVLNAQLRKRISEMEQTEGSNKTLTSQLKEKDDKIAKIRQYNEVFKYINQVIEVHSGLTGITQEEFDVGLAKAATVGDQNLTDTLKWAWNEQSINQVTRLIGVYKAISTGIDNNTK